MFEMHNYKIWKFWVIFYKIQKNETWIQSSGQYSYQVHVYFVYKHNI